MTGIQIISNARKLVLVPATTAPTVEFPNGVKVGEYSVLTEGMTVVVCNGTEDEPSWQGVNAESGAVLVNEVPGEIAEVALGILQARGIDAALYYLLTQGCGDQYTSPWDFIDPKLSPAGLVLSDRSGIYKRDDRDLIDCWREGDEIHVYTDGDRVVQPDILKRTYRMADGSEIDIDAIPQKNNN